MSSSKRPTPEERVTRIVTGSFGYDQPNQTPFEGMQAELLTVGSRSYAGTTTPGFATSKLLPWNPYSQFSMTMSPGLVESMRSVTYLSPYEADSYKVTNHRHWVIGLNYQQLQSHDPDAEIACSKRLAGQFNKVQVNLGQFFAERQQFTNMISKTAYKLVHAVRSVKSLRFGEAARALGIKGFSRKKELRLRRKARLAASEFKDVNKPDMYLASTWLELQYGWRPLLSDVYNAAELLGSRLRSDEFSESKMTSGSSQRNWTEDYPNLTLSYTQENAARFFRKTTCKYHAKFRSSNEVKQAFAVTGISNPLLLAWELVPFSFVVDWFLPVGNFIEQMSAYNGFEFSSIHRTLFTRATLDLNHTYSNSASNDVYVFAEIANGSGFYQNVLYDRSNILQPAEVPLEFKSPISVDHALNALALLKTVFGKR